ncbi:DEAD/DEAH box helicase family protein [Fervidobacterium sp.]
MGELSILGDHLEARTPYHPGLVAAFRAAGGRWDPGARVWRLPLHRVPLLNAALKERSLDAMLGDGLKRAQEIWEARRMEGLAAIEEAPLLTPEQREDARTAFVALYRALEGKGAKGVLLANGTGTGKTYVYAGFLRAVEALGLPALLVVPNEDLARQTKEVLSAVGASPEIATYGTLDPEQARGRVLVLDEAHLAKRAFRSDRGKRTWRAVERSLFALYATATPFDRPWESEYLLVPSEALEAWGEGEFEDFMARFKVYTREGFGGGREWYFAGGPEDLAAFHNHLKTRGFMTRRLYVPPEGLVEHEVPFVEVPREEKELLAEVRRRLKLAAEKAHPEERGIIMAHRTLLSRALLERMKLRAALPLLEGLLAEGWHVALFLQYRADRELDLSTPESVLTFLAEAEERGERVLARHLAPALAGLKLTLPSPTDLVRAHFEASLGEALGFYTGAESQGALKRTKEAWNEGRIRLLVATAAKGGTGLSLHDTTGKRPTAQVVLTLPWTGSQLDQVLGRVVRVGLASPVRVLLPAAPVPAERRLAAVVAESLRTLGHAVRGGRMPVPERVVRAFLHDLASVDPEGFYRLLLAEERRLLA